MSEPECIKSFNFFNCDKIIFLLMFTNNISYLFEATESISPKKHETFFTLFNNKFSLELTNAQLS